MNWVAELIALSYQANFYCPGHSKELKLKESTYSRVVVLLVLGYLSAICVPWPKVARSGLPVKLTGDFQV